MELSQLASVLREHGDQVLNGESKLSLSTTLLKDLNESFSLIIEEREALSSTFQVISTSNSKIELLLDLQFLHDFVQRTVGLKLIGNSPEICDLVSIHKFKNLKLLELRKVPLNQLTGLQSLRNQLQYITCVRCVQDLKELFINCGGDKSQAYIWSELKEAVLSYNNLESIDNSFEYVPWLQTLDISHNLISNAQSIDCLPNLKHLNLGFNHLETVPIFKKELFRNLQILILKSNYIGDLIGLLYLDNLVTLDLSCNCLVDHEILSPLSHLAALQWLNLEGNPLSFHPHHRDITCRYLHSNTSTVKFLLDKTILTKQEKKLIGTYHPSVPSKFVRMRREHQSSVSSNISDITNSSEITAIATSDLTRSQSSQRGKKVRDAIISEKDENEDILHDNDTIINSEFSKSVNTDLSISVSEDYLETQKRIESLRNQYGEDWLHNQGGSIMQDILGIEKTEPKQSSTPYEQDFIRHAADVLAKSEEININAPSQFGDADKTDVTSDISGNVTFLTASESSIFEDKDLIQSESTSINSDSEEQFDEDENERPFIAQVTREGLEPDMVFIIISEKYLKERDIGGRVKSKWLLEIILSCEVRSVNPTVLRIEFDTVRRNMKQREYIFEDEEAQKFHKEISNILSQKPLSAMNQAIYCCMKCSTQFSRDKEKSIINSHQLPNCPNPNCGSTLVYEVDEESTPTNRSQSNIFKTDRAKSPSECSIASETESNQLAQIHVTAEVHMDINASTSVPANCSAASVQESISSQFSTEDTPSSDTILRKYESDIEVISNPSQSSIEVLDEQFRPGRKRSSEERKTLMQPTLVTIPDVVVPVSTTVSLPGLTESSSSSSFTESICTAYDTTHHVSRPSSGLEIRGVIKEEQETNQDKKTKEEEKSKKVLNSLLEGLFSGPTTGIKSSKISSNENDVQFTFTEDFSNVDHRIKYHLYQNIFEDENENFVWILRCVLLNSNLVKPIDGCLVLSTYKVYILYVKEHEIGDDVSNWLVKKESYTIDRLQTLYSLPWKQGIGLEIRDVSKKNINYLCVLQDMQRTSNFLAFLASNPLPDSCDLVCVPPERPMLNLQHLLLSHRTEDISPKDSTLCLFSVFSKCVITTTDIKNIRLGVLLVTSTDLILVSDLDWLLPDSEKELKIFASQPMNNLLEIESENLTLDFHFLDEIVSCEEVWAVEFETSDSLSTAISAIKSPWEKIFSVPMQVNHKIHSA